MNCVIQANNFVVSIDMMPSAGEYAISSVNLMTVGAMVKFDCWYWVIDPKMDFVIFFSEELKKEKAKLQAIQGEARKLRNELQKVLAEGDGYRAAAVLAEKSQKEELETMRSKYQEEIASLQHIMSGKLNYWIN